ncbi:hypothetical protein O3P69_010684 [Scylla paramamosain]|uniref:Uncharacterized protein n=1 Tax=Scylla paramamosain TaxID=85552 RepID=A0AAW0TEI2_SCYPA
MTQESRILRQSSGAGLSFGSKWQSTYACTRKIVDFPFLGAFENLVAVTCDQTSGSNSIRGAEEGRVTRRRGSALVMSFD